MRMRAKVVNVSATENGARIDVGDLETYGRYRVYIPKANVLPGDEVMLLIERVGVGKSGSLYMAGEVVKE
jgi:hypothetical protein